MLPWRLYCLGYPSFEGPGGEPIRLRTRKHLAVLIYLAIEPATFHRRDRIATLLWPRVGLDEARHSLATALSVLRARLGRDAFESRSDTIRLVPGRVVTDVALLVSGDALGADIDVAPFLEEFEIPSANDFECWVEAERVRLLPAIHAQIAGRIAEARKSGDTRKMEQLAERLVRIDPLSEHAARAAMEVLALTGDRIGAIRGYDKWRRHLSEELGARPSLDVDRIADRLRRRGLADKTSTALVPVPTEQWQERSFIGRAEEYRCCYELWQEVRVGNARYLMILGKDGMGKTTLINRVGTSLALEGAGVVRVQCYELERELPFGTVSSLVEQLIDLPGAGATRTVALAELGQMSGKARDRWPGLPAVPNAPGECSRLQYTEALVALVSAVADEQPVVLAVDDYHLADAASLAVLHLLLRRIGHLPVLILFSTIEPSIGIPRVPEWFTDSRERVRGIKLSLGPMDSNSSMALLSKLFEAGDDPGPSVRRAILNGAQGVPVVIEFLAEDWRRRGTESLAITLGAMTSESDYPAEAFAALVANSLDTLDSETRAVAGLAALLGRRLNALGMYSLLDLPVARTMRALSQLTASRILRDAGTHLEFTNEVIRAHCYAALACPMRRHLHAQVADCLVAETGQEEPIEGLEIAWHLVRAGRLAQAVPYLLAGGREAVRRGGPHEADLALSTGLPALTGSSRRTAILLLAEALQELGRWQESLTLLRDTDDSWEPEEDYLREVMSIISRQWLGSMNDENLNQYTDRALELSRCASQPGTKAMAIATVVLLLSTSHDPARKSQLAIALSDAKEVQSDSYQQLHLLHAHAWLLASSRSLEGSLEALQAAIEIAEEHGYLSTIVIRLRLGEGNILALLGRYHSAIAPLESAALCAQRLDNASLAAEAYTLLAVVSARIGDAKQQFEYANSALSLQRDQHHRPSSKAAAYELAMALAVQGRAVEAISTIDSVLDPRLITLPSWGRQAALLNAADVYWVAGRTKAALRFAAKALAAGDGSALHESLGGPFARWMVRVSLTADGASGSRSRNTIARLNNSNPILDAKDQVEVIAARGMLLAATDEDCEAERREVILRLGKLPPGIGESLSLFGFHPTDWKRY